MIRFEYIDRDDQGRELARMLFVLSGELPSLTGYEEPGLYEQMRSFAMALGYTPQCVEEVFGDSDGVRPVERELEKACAELRAENDRLEVAIEGMRADLEAAKQEAADAAAQVANLLAQRNAVEIRTGAPGS